MTGERLVTEACVFEQDVAAFAASVASGNIALAAAAGANDFSWDVWNADGSQTEGE
jgi:hypothetical protein